VQLAAHARRCQGVDARRARLGVQLPVEDLADQALRQGFELLVEAGLGRARVGARVHRWWAQVTKVPGMLVLAACDCQRLR
jgi:hypothetical protein